MLPDKPPVCLFTCTVFVQLYSLLNTEVKNFLYHEDWDDEDKINENDILNDYL